MSKISPEIRLLTYKPVKHRKTLEDKVPKMTTACVYYMKSHKIKFREQGHNCKTKKTKKENEAKFKPLIRFFFFTSKI